MYGLGREKDDPDVSYMGRWEGSMGGGKREDVHEASGQGVT